MKRIGVLDDYQGMAREMPGWDAEVIDENNLGRYGPRDLHGGADHEVLQEQRPADVVGFYGGLTSTIPRLYDLARFYHGLSVPTLAGNIDKRTVSNARGSAGLPADQAEKFLRRHATSLRPRSSSDVDLPERTRT